MPILRRLRDGEGYSGSLVEAIKFDPPNKPKVVGDKPIIGCSLKVGTLGAGMFTTRDWWMTTAVAEILEKKKGYTKFKTVNGSVYELVEYDFRRPKKKKKGKGKKK